LSGETDGKGDRRKPVGSVTFSGAAGRPSIYYALWISNDPKQRQSVRRQLREQAANPRRRGDKTDENPLDWSYETHLEGRKE
jgi:hypothetical protein